ncbi:hypothetical protein SUGI_1033490 [Cryptomeria japonica]|nr:hypothetical protein SUGI_1033490 [Cryptomeria japonica]
MPLPKAEALPSIDVNGKMTASTDTSHVVIKRHVSEDSEAMLTLTSCDGTFFTFSQRHTSSVIGNSLCLYAVTSPSDDGYAGSPKNNGENAKM